MESVVGQMQAGRVLNGLKTVAGYVLIVLLIATSPVWGIPALMWKGVKKLNARVGQMKKTLIGVGVVSVGAFALIYGLAIQFSVFTAGVLMAAIGCALFYVVVRYGHNEIDTIHELTERQNMAVSKYFLNYALIIAAVLAAALVAGF